MPKQDWSARNPVVWVLGYTTEDGFSVEVYENDQACIRNAAEYALQVIENENWGIEGTEELLQEARKLWEAKKYEDLLSLQEEEVSEGRSDIRIHVFEEQVRKS